MPNLPWEYMRECSDTGLQNVMLAALNEAAALEKIIRAEEKKRVTALARAEVARILIERREELARVSAEQGTLSFDKLQKSA